MRSVGIEMKRTEEYRFSILSSTLARHERACASNGRTGVKHDLSNVNMSDDRITVGTTTDQHIELTGSSLLVDGVEIPIEQIQEIRWITREPNPADAARQKQDDFDRLHIKHRRKWITLDGLGQSVFPIMHFLKWAKENG